MSNLYLELQKKLDERIIQQKESLKFIFFCIDTWAQDEEINESQKRRFWKAMNELKIITMPEIFKEVCNVKDEFAELEAVKKFYYDFCEKHGPEEVWTEEVKQLWNEQ